MHSKTLADQIADLDDPAPKDHDPEALNGENFASDEEDIFKDLESGREHYENVGRSKLRSLTQSEMGPRYAGSRVSREELSDDDGYDDPFGLEDRSDDSNRPGKGLEENDIEGDEEFQGLGNEYQDGGLSRIQSRSQMEDADMGDSSDGSAGADPDGLDVESESLSGESEDAESENEDVEDGDSEGQSDERKEPSPVKPSKESFSREELRKMMGDEAKLVAGTLSEAARSDAQKGKAVRQQRKLFDSLLNSRIRLQKGLIATNTLSLADSEGENKAHEEPYLAAEKAAISLWNSLNKLQDQMSSPRGSKDTSTSKKRKFVAEPETDSLSMWKDMQTRNSIMTAASRTTLDKWSAKIKGTSAMTATRNKLNTSAQAQQQQPITAILDLQLTDSGRLIERTRVPRSCAPVQASNLKGGRKEQNGHQNGVAEGAPIYDDADFYQLLLKELVDQRMADSSATADNAMMSGIVANGSLGFNAMREAKTRKDVDTRASKGRKMRYTVHEKLQNFVAPEDRGSWGRRQTDELFGSLFGRQIQLNEGEGEDASDSDDGGVPMASENGLALFRR